MRMGQERIPKKMLHAKRRKNDKEEDSESDV
jgi:hypothetical protein